jgi:hypothetical protein
MKQSFDAASTVVDCRGYPAFPSIIVTPAAGNTVNVFVSLDDDPNAVGATWQAWDAGAVTAQTARAATGPITGVKATRTVGSTAGNLLFVRRSTQDGG